MGSSAFAYQWQPGVPNPEVTDPERCEQVQEMFENQDYNSFQELFEWRWPTRHVENKEDFGKFIQLRDARIDWDTQKIEQLSQELGMWQGNGNGAGAGKWNWAQRGNGMWNWNGVR